MRAARATDGGARSMRPPRGADGVAGRTEPGAMRGRSRLERAAAQYTAGAGGVAVGLTYARGAGRARAVRATERRRAGCGQPSMGSGRRWRHPGWRRAKLEQDWAASRWSLRQWIRLGSLGLDSVTSRRSSRSSRSSRYSPEITSRTPMY